MAIRLKHRDVDGDAERLMRQTFPNGINDSGEVVWREILPLELCCSKCGHSFTGNAQEHVRSAKELHERNCTTTSKDLADVRWYVMTNLPNSDKNLCASVDDQPHSELRVSHPDSTHGGHARLRPESGHPSPVSPDKRLGPNQRIGPNGGVVQVDYSLAEIAPPESNGKLRQFVDRLIAQEAVDEKAMPVCGYILCGGCPKCLSATGSQRFQSSAPPMTAQEMRLREEAKMPDSRFCLHSNPKGLCVERENAEAQKVIIRRSLCGDALEVVGSTLMEARQDVAVIPLEQLPRVVKELAALMTEEQRKELVRQVVLTTSNLQVYETTYLRASTEDLSRPSFNADFTLESGPGISSKPESEPIAFLDEDLLCDDE